MPHPFMDAAKAFAEAIQDSIPELQQRQQELERELAEVHQKIDDAKQALSRVATYKPSEGLCPLCWVERADAHQLKSMTSESSANEYECPHCFWHIEIPA